jgi:hypothetical protein
MTGYTAAVAGYLVYCERAAAELKAAGSALDPKYNPTAGGCVKMVPHRGDPAEAKAIRQAYRDLTEDPGGEAE